MPELLQLAELDWSYTSVPPAAGWPLLFPVSKRGWHKWPALGAHPGQEPWMSARGS